MSTQTDLVNVATALSTAANALATTSTAIGALVAKLQSGGTGPVDQATLDSVTASLDARLARF